MKKHIALWAVPALAVLLSGCGPVGHKAGSLVVIYTVTTALSLLVLGGYCALAKKKEGWFVLLLGCVAVVNGGYLALAMARTLAAALWANRLAYLGSVFLPLAMAMILSRVTAFPLPRWAPAALLGLGGAVFCVAASPGILPIYYKEVALITVDGVSVLEKVYGPWHALYLYYLAFYFLVTAGLVVRAWVKKSVPSPVHGLILAFILFANQGVWLLEQLVKLDFEILSVSYIISELCLLGVSAVAEENELLRQQAVAAERPAECPAECPPPPPPVPSVDQEMADHFFSGLARLTPTERKIYDAYRQGQTTREIMEALDIKENTLKFHNKNLYSKMGVSSRKQLLWVADILDPRNEEEE